MTVCGKHKKSRTELGCAIMTVENENKVCGRHNNGRMELGCTKRLLRMRTRSVESIKRAVELQ